MRFVPSIHGFVTVPHHTSSDDVGAIYVHLEDFTIARLQATYCIYDYYVCGKILRTKTRVLDNGIECPILGSMYGNEITKIAAT